MLTLTKLGAALSSTLAIIAGFYLLQAEGIGQAGDLLGDLDDGSIGIALGLYFVAKGLQLGPSLWAQDETRRYLAILASEQDRGEVVARAPVRHEPA